MTDHAPRADDEIVSAHLDGEATPDEVARVTADPAAQVTLTAFERVRLLVAEPVTPSVAARETALAAALGLFDQGVDATPDAPHTIAADPAVEAAAAATPITAIAPVVDLASRRSARSLRLLSAAAAVFVLLGVVAVARIATTQDVSNDVAGAPAIASTTTSAADLRATAQPENPSPNAASDTPSTTFETTGAPIGPDRSAPSTPAPSAPPTTSDERTNRLADLGILSNRHDLRLAVAGALTTSTDAGSSPPTGPSSDRTTDTTTASATAPPRNDATAAVSRCDTARRAADPEITDLVLAASATYQGVPALVLSYRIDPARSPAANGTLRTAVLNPSDCSVLLEDTV